MSTNYLGSNVCGSASPAAAVPEGALPPLPDPIEVGGEGWDWEDFQSWKTFTVDQMQAYARAAVEADRVQLPAPIALNGRIHTAAEVKQRIMDLDAENAALHAQHDKASAHIAKLEAALADRAQQGEPVGDVRMSQFLTDAVTAAGLLSHGKRDKRLASRIAGRAYDIRLAMTTPPQAGQSPEQVTPDCGAIRDQVLEEAAILMVAHGEPALAQLIRGLKTQPTATKAAAPADAPEDHEIREAINQLREVAVQFHATQQLRARIANIVLPLLKRAAPVPDTGIPTSGEVEKAGWISVDDRLPEQKDRPYQVLAICKKEYGKDSCYPGQGKRGVYQDWVLRNWPNNYAYWMLIPAAPHPSEAKAGEDA